jgi:hypothetical protein
MERALAWLQAAARPYTQLCATVRAGADAVCLLDQGPGGGDTGIMRPAVAAKKQQQSLNSWEQQQNTFWGTESLNPGLGGMGFPGRATRKPILEEHCLQGRIWMVAAGVVLTC